MEKTANPLTIISRFIWVNNSKMIGIAGVIALAAGFISGSSSVIMGAWTGIALLSFMALVYSEKRVRELEEKQGD